MQVDQSTRPKFSEVLGDACNISYLGWYLVSVLHELNLIVIYVDCMDKGIQIYLGYVYLRWSADQALIE